MSDNSRLYEGMFLVDSNRAAQDWNGVTDHIHQVITRNGGDIARSEKWDERKLAFPISGHNRATYIIVHFNAPPGQLETMSREYQLSDVVLRELMIKDEDGLSAEIPKAKENPMDPLAGRRRERDVSIPDSARTSRGPSFASAASEEQSKPEADAAEESPVEEESDDQKESSEEKSSDSDSDEESSDEESSDEESSDEGSSDEGSSEEESSDEESEKSEES